MQGSRAQAGFALLAFVLALSVVAFSFVLGYSVNLTRQQADAQPRAQQAYLQGLQDTLLQVYRERATHPVEPATPAAVAQWRAFGPDEDALALASATLRWGVRAAISEPQPDGQGAPYQRIALWLPLETEAENPPDIEHFRATGQWRGCTKPAPCVEPPFVLVDGQLVQRVLHAQAQERLMRVAQKLQAYFKARMLQNPERNVAVNYFRNPRGGTACPSTPPAPELRCLDTYRPLGAADPVAVHANLVAADLVSPWGEPLQASNLQDSETVRPPFSMALRVQVKGTAEYLRAIALQPF